VLLYVFFWGLLHRDLRVGAAFLVLLPVTVTPWFYGALGGVFAGMAGLLCNALYHPLSSYLLPRRQV